MGKIATEQEAYNIGKQGTPHGNKCCTKARVETLGCKVSESYASNQLVQLEDLSPAGVILELGLEANTSLPSNWGYIHIFGASLKRIGGMSSDEYILGNPISIQIFTYNTFTISVDMQYDSKTGNSTKTVLPKTTTYADWEITKSYFGANDYPVSYVYFSITFY